MCYPFLNQKIEDGISEGMTLKLTGNNVQCAKEDDYVKPCNQTLQSGNMNVWIHT